MNVGKILKKIWDIIAVVIVGLLLAVGISKPGETYRSSRSTDSDGYRAGSDRRRRRAAERRNRFKDIIGG